MKIAYLNADSGVPVFGAKGCSVHVQEMLLAMVKAGHEVRLFTARMSGEAPPELKAVQIHLLPRLPKDDAVAREQAALASNAGLRQMLEKEFAATAFELVYERHSLWSHAGMEFARERHIPGVLEVNAPLIEEQASHRTLIDRAAAEEAATLAFRSASVITAVSRQLAQILERHPAARGKVHVVPNAVNAQRFASVAPALPKNGAFVIGFVGTLKPWHGLMSLMESFTRVAHELPNAKLLIVGDGPERAPLEREIAARGLVSRVQFTGAIPPAAVAPWLASMDVAVAPYPPSDRFYFSPLKLYEYMAAGRPIVASRIGQVEEVIQDRETGILVPPGDTAAMAGALMELERKPALRARLGDAAQQAVRDRTWDKALAYILSLTGLGSR